VLSLPTGQVAALHALGPNYQSIFAPTDSNPLLDQAPAAATLLIHSKEALGSRLVLSYNAQAAAGRMLYNTTDMDGAADVEHQTAAVQEGSQLCCTCHLRDLLHCLGGVSVLLPLVSPHFSLITTTTIQIFCFAVLFQCPSAAGKPIFL